MRRGQTRGILIGGLLRCAAVCFALLLAAGFTACEQPPPEPETNADGFEFPARTLFVGDREYLLTLRLAARRGGAAELGYAVYGDCELVVRSSAREELAVLGLNQYFGGRPVGFAEAAFPEEGGNGRYFQDYDDRSAVLFAIGQDAPGRADGGRVFVPFELNSSGGLSALPVADGGLISSEKGDFLDFSDSYGDKLLRLKGVGEERAEYVWNGEEYRPREAEEAFDAKLRLQLFSAPVGTAAAPEGERLVYTVACAGAEKADYFYFEGRLREGNSIPYQQSLYQVRGQRARRIIRQEGLGAPLSGAVFEAAGGGGTLWWNYEDGRAYSYDLETGEVQEQEWAPTRILQGYALLPSPNQPEYVFRELATGRVVRISRAGTGQAANRLVELAGGKLPLIRQQGKKFTLTLTDLASGTTGPAYDVSFVGLGGEMEVAIQGDYAVITSLFYEESAMYLYNLQTGEHRKLLSGRTLTPKDVHFVGEERLLFLDRYLGGSVCLYDIPTGRMTYPDGFAPGQWGGIHTSPDGRALLVARGDGSQVVAVTTEENDKEG